MEKSAWAVSVKNAAGRALAAQRPGLGLNLTVTTRRGVKEEEEEEEEEEEGLLTNNE